MMNSSMLSDPFCLKSFIWFAGDKLMFRHTKRYPKLSISTDYAGMDRFVGELIIKLPTNCSKQTIRGEPYTCYDFI